MLLFSAHSCRRTELLCSLEREVPALHMLHWVLRHGLHFQGSREVIGLLKWEVIWKVLHYA